MFRRIDAIYTSVPYLHGLDRVRGGNVYINNFSKDIFDMPTAFLYVRNFLDSRRANLQQNSSLRVVMTLAHGLYVEAEDREAAVQTSKLIVVNVRRVRIELRTGYQPTSVH